MRKLITQHKQAWASLKKKPGFVLTVVMTMGITLGALLCAITLNYLLLVKPLPYPEEDRLFVAEHQLIGSEKEVMGNAYTYPGLVHLYKNRAAFKQVAIMMYDQDVIVSHSSQPLVNTAYVTPEFHQILASPLALGRLFEASEALDTNNPVAILSYNTWQQKFHGSTDILEQKIILSGISYSIIGILAKNFVEPELHNTGLETQVWMPFDYNPADERQRQSFGNIDSNLIYIGLLKQGVSKNQAQQLLTPLVNHRWQEGVAAIDFFKGWSIKIRVYSAKERILGNSEPIAAMLLAGVMGLVLISCTNIANLFMSRTAEKQRQMAILAALGATKKHLFNATFAETSLLMLLSIILALVLANGGFYIMQQYLTAVLPRVNELHLHPITFGCAVIITIVFAFFFAKLSTRMINYRALNSTLQSSGKGSGLQVSKKTRQILIASQVALATVLVFANISLLKDAVKTINTPIGFATDNISTLRLSFASQNLPSQEQRKAVMAEIMAKLSALPQVESIAQGKSPLNDYWDTRALINVTNNKRYTPFLRSVDHRYFTMIEQQILQGDNFTLADIQDSNRVIIVNQALAKQLRADGDVIGMKISLVEPKTFIIIGIVKDITIPGDIPAGSDSAANGVPRAYAPNSLSDGSFLLKLKVGQSISRDQLAALIAEVDSRYAVFSFNADSDMLTQSLFAEITTAVTTAVLASLVFLLAGIGLYGILSYSTQLRRFEIGARMAIGATRKHLIAMIIVDNTKAVLVGFIGSVILFALAYIGLSEYIQPFLTWQVLPMVIATLILISLITLFACYWPLRQYINKATIFSLRGSD